MPILETGTPRPESASIIERGQWVLAEAQIRLLISLMGNNVEERELLKHGKSSQEIVALGETYVRLAAQSEKVVYKKRGKWEHLEGFAERWGEVNSTREVGSSRGGAEWQMFGHLAKKRMDFAREVVEEFGFDVIGKDVPPRAPYREVDSYDIEPQLPYAGNSHQNLAISNMQIRLTQGSENHILLEKTRDLRSEWGFDFCELRGAFEGKPLVLSVQGQHSGNNLRYAGVISGEELSDDRAKSLFLEIGEIVTIREAVASQILDHEQNILEHLGVA